MVLRQHAQLVGGAGPQPHQRGVGHAARQDLHRAPLALRALAVPHVVLHIQPVVACSEGMLSASRLGLGNNLNFLTIIRTWYPRKVDGVEGGHGREVVGRPRRHVLDEQLRLHGELVRLVANRARVDAAVILLDVSDCQVSFHQ